ncbi:MAG: hypothetical protein DHS20C12_11860 [Pseudohongiella sp.]|nr:MAG: hypothetical protein DHS20C12_11860 [Pseudohongiella sp.]
MAMVSKVALLPPEVRAWLDHELMERGFGDYTQLTEQLNSKLSSHGLELSVSRTGLGAYGKDLKDRIEDIRASTEAAKLLNMTMDDDGDALAMANIAQAQHMIFKIMNRYDLDDEDSQISVKEIGILFRSLGNISRASLPLKQWSKKVREELARKTEALAEEINTVDGLSTEHAEMIKRKVLGIKIDD